MSRDELLRQARRNVHHSHERTVPLVDSIVRVPSRNYVDHDRWRLEMDRIFGRLPLLLGFSCELPEPHSYKAFDAMGVPLLLTRADDGVVRGFVNMCSHRGAIVMEDGCGVARRMTCPYHAWTYDTHGSLVGVLDKANFGDFDMASAGLTPIPVTERAGIIFGGIVPGSLGDTTFDVDPFLCGYGDMLEHLDLANCTFVGRQKVEGPNWKVAYDGYLDFYHLPILHKNTFGPTYNNRTINDAWGPHQRNVQPDDRWLALEELPEEEWTDRRITTGVWTIFPHVSVAGFDAGGKLYMISQLFPGDTPGTSVTTQNFLATFEPDDEQRSLIDKQMDFLMRVVRDEDYYTGLRIQRAVATGAKQHIMFGRNEGPCQRFHSWVDDLIGAETPADTAALYANATEHHDP
jgi:phenylpropionate dioxygenase-like ring-hydroxylating dioxygenase large terminal subunit